MSTSRSRFAIQWAIHKNSAEPASMLWRRLFWTCVYLMVGARYGLAGIRRMQLGSSVRYKGEVWSVVNWPYQKTSTLSRTGQYEEHVPRESFCPIMSLSELWHRFRVMRGWYVGYWLDIHVSQRLRGEPTTDIRSFAGPRTK